MFFFHFISNQNQNKIPKLCTIWGLYFKSSYQTRAGSEMPKLTCKINLQSNIGFVFVKREKKLHTLKIVLFVHSMLMTREVF